MRERVCHAHHCDEPGERRRAADDDQDACAVGNGLAEVDIHILEIDIAIDDNSQNECIDNSDTRRLSRAEYAGPDTADNDDRSHQGKQGFLGGDQSFLAVERLNRIISLFCKIENEAAGNECQQKAGNHTADEKLTYRYFSHHSVDDHRDGRRNDRSDRSGLRCNSRRELRVKAFLDHSVNFDLSESAGVCNCRSAHTGEDNGSDDVSVSESAGNPAHPCRACSEEPPGDTTGVHQLSCQDEERDCQQCIGTGVTDHSVNDSGSLKLACDHRSDECRNGK